MKDNERSGSAFKIKDDPRITYIGKFIRKYSVDEIPQLFNVLKGDMSLIGPRPQVLWETEEYDETAKRRLSILPGVTGLWQVSGRSDLSFEEMIQLDIYYLENWTLGFDLKILLRTIPVVILKKGAC
jgi:lipopolysaccharide/colanic/teichoic acid biosynthesis glycosyltransferase